MTRRPPTLLTLCRRLLRSKRLFERGQLVLCAVSGGPDSMALLHALALMRKRRGHRLAAVGIDHGLRDGAGAELDAAEQLASDHEVPFERIRLDMERGSNLQARARSARHAALQACAQRRDAACIALGHTADDRAETLIMRLLRGSGPHGLAVMPARTHGIEGTVELVRPLLLARRSDVLAHLQRHGVPFAHDPSNRDRRFLRVRVRHEVIPLLEELSPGVVDHLCTLADALVDQRDETDPLATLNRTQRQQIQRLLRRGYGRTTVRVSGNRDLEIGFFRQSPVFSSKQ